MHRALLVLLIVPLPACIDYSAIVDDVTDPGGTVRVSLDTGTPHVTAALGNGKATPLTVQGGSSELTFALTAADAANGAGDARTLLAQPGAQVTLQLDAPSISRLEVHLEGMGCVASTGTVHLTTDASNELGGDFTAQGTVSGGTAPCRIDGTLAGVPVER